MNKKNIVRFSFITVFILFLCIYIGQATGYYEYNNYKKTTLTNDAINRFEEDVKNGKTIDAKNYMEQDKSYENSLNKAAIKTSNVIEGAFDKMMEYIFKEVNNVVNDK